ncbi:MAG: D-glycerate dehydrogenase [Firmicutes bacterium]|jgi:glyoxylate reductase|nr:D-glycerate dehydrogenase [Bacillota bacterium]
MRVYVTRKLPDEVAGILTPFFEVESWPHEDVPVSRSALLSGVETADGLVRLLTDRIDRSVLDGARRLKIVANVAVGFDNVDVGACTERGIAVTNTPGVLTESTADLAFALLLAAARRIPEAQDALKRFEWKAWSLMFLTGRDVHSATLGIVGMGRIGRAVARRAAGFSMRILYYSRRRDAEIEGETGAVFRPLDELLRESDFVSIHLPLTEETRHLIGERELSLMKPTSVLVNTSRGPVVDEAALCHALERRTIWAAGLDVYEEEPLPAQSPLRSLDNVVLLPHIGSATVTTRTRMASMAAENVREFLLRGKALTPVNPEVLALRRAIEQPNAD